MDIQIYIKELVYDIQNKTYITGRTHEAADSGTYASASNMQASDDSENSYQIHRSLHSAFAALKCAIAEYLPATADETSANNLIATAIDQEGVATVTLAMPSNFHPAGSEQAAAAIHKYLVEKAISDWFELTNKAEAQSYAGQAEESLNQARRALCRRKRPTRNVVSD